jgi:hypothetical protein
MFKDSANSRVVTRWALQLDQQFMLEKGDTVVMLEQIKKVCKRAGIKPEYFACDRTGHGAGIADLLKHEWSPAIHDVNYSNNPTDKKLMEEDSKTCKEEYGRICCELWFGLHAYASFGYLLIHPSVRMEKLAEQVTQRKFTTASKQKKVQSKKDYISTGLESPDEADSLTLFVYAARMGSGVILSMKGEDVGVPGEEDDGWYDERPLIGGSRIDPSNRADYLDERYSNQEPIL